MLKITCAADLKWGLVPKEGSSSTPAEDTGATIGGCAYSTKATDSGTYNWSYDYYLLSISYDQALSLLKRRLGIIASQKKETDIGKRLAGIRTFKAPGVSTKAVPPGAAFFVWADFFDFFAPVYLDFF
jgi:hypothetical protein